MTVPTAMMGSAMKLTLALALCVAWVAGCTTHPTTTTRMHRPEAQSISYYEYIAKRTEELQRMGGPFKDANVASNKAAEEAKNRFGDAPADHTTTWVWGKKKKGATQAKVDEQWKKTARDRSVP